MILFFGRSGYNPGPAGETDTLKPRTDSHGQKETTQAVHAEGIQEHRQERGQKHGGCSRRFRRIARPLLAHCSPEMACLTGEVQTFLSKRDELAQKLAREIEITEKKLAELKHSAAMLFPEKDSVPYAESEHSNNLIGLRTSL